MAAYRHAPRTPRSVSLLHAGVRKWGMRRVRQKCAHRNIFRTHLANTRHRSQSVHGFLQTHGRFEREISFGNRASQRTKRGSRFVTNIRGSEIGFHQIVGTGKHMGQPGNGSLNRSAETAHQCDQSSLRAATR